MRKAVTYTLTSSPVGLICMHMLLNVLNANTYKKCEIVDFNYGSEDSYLSMDIREDDISNIENGIVNDLIKHLHQTDKSSPMVRQ